jgi:hypothetical protein
MNSSGEPDVDPLRLIVKPKLRAPIPRHGQVVRPRLLELLGNASNRRIALLTDGRSLLWMLPGGRGNHPPGHAVEHTSGTHTLDRTVTTRGRS